MPGGAHGERSAPGAAIGAATADGDATATGAGIAGTSAGALITGIATGEPAAGVATAGVPAEGRSVRNPSRVCTSSALGRPILPIGWVDFGSNSPLATRVTSSTNWRTVRNRLVGLLSSARMISASTGAGTGASDDGVRIEPFTCARCTSSTEPACTGWPVRT